MKRAITILSVLVLLGSCTMTNVDVEKPEKKVAVSDSTKKPAPLPKGIHIIPTYPNS